MAAVLVFALRSSSPFGGTRYDTEELADSIAAVLQRKEPPRSITAKEWTRVRRMYETRANRPIWVERNGRFGAQAADLVSAIRQSDRQGLRVADYPAVELEKAIDEADSLRTLESVARAEVLLSATYVDLASDLLTGRLDPRRVTTSWHIDQKAFDIDSAVVASLGDGRDVSRALATMRPAEAGYETLVDELRRYRQLEDSGGWRKLPESPKLRPGVVHSAVAALRQRLAIEGYAASSDAERPEAYDRALAAAVAQFQLRHGLPVDSAVGPATRAALDVSAGRRADQIAANLERMRWLPPVLPGRRIVVNIPDYHLEAFDGGRKVLDMRVVVGDELEGRKTPIFADSMQFVEFGPYWNVPEKIAIEEILPLAQENPGYLEANDYEVVAGKGEDATVMQGAFSVEDIAAGRYRIRQRPGPKNALGHVKFLFPNEFAVYLHDTPARSLFANNQRAASHGCVRVADPAALARFVLQDQPEWTPERIDAALAAVERERVTLQRSIPVYLIYLTAFVRDGALHFRDDIYESDATLVRLVDEDVPNVAARDSVAREAATRLAQRLAKD